MPANTFSRYLLLNKDKVVLRFVCTRNEFDEPIFREEQWEADYRPIGYRDLAGFLERRKAPKHRRHIKELLERCGCDDPEGFLRVTHALSLNDTFWVKEDGAHLSWADVSLYRNEFNQLISEAAFDGSAGSVSLSSTSPEFGTGGCFAKCWIRENGGIYLCKCGSPQLEIEPLSEYLAAQLSPAVCPGAVAYDLDYYRSKLVCKCALFTDENHGLAKASHIFGVEKTIPELLAYFDSIGSGDAFRRMCVLDAIILNPDRHYGNFGVLFDTSTMAVLRMAPVFDHNRSLFPELDDDQLLAPEWYLRRCTPKLGKDFLRNGRGLLTDAIRQDLKNLAGFRFQQHPKIHAEQRRLDALSNIANRQIKSLLAAE